MWGFIWAFLLVIFVKKSPFRQQLYFILIAAFRYVTYLFSFESVTKLDSSLWNMIKTLKCFFCVFIVGQTNRWEKGRRKLCWGHKERGHPTRQLCLCRLQILLSQWVGHDGQRWRNRPDRSDWIRFQWESPVTTEGIKARFRPLHLFRSHRVRARGQEVRQYYCHRLVFVLNKLHEIHFASNSRCFITYRASHLASAAWLNFFKFLLINLKNYR